MDDYVSKPVRPQALVDVLRRWIPAAEPERRAGRGARDHGARVHPVAPLGERAAPPALGVRDRV
jgi:hypothetical protein